MKSQIKVRNGYGNIYDGEVRCTTGKEHPNSRLIGSREYFLQTDECEAPQDLAKAYDIPVRNALRLHLQNIGCVFYKALYKDFDVQKP